MFGSIYFKIRVLLKSLKKILRRLLDICLHWNPIPLYGFVFLSLFWVRKGIKQEYKFIRNF